MPLYAQQKQNLSQNQVILDYAFVSTLKDMVDSILRDSCVPKEFQVIDDRKIIR